MKNLIYRISSKIRKEINLECIWENAFKRLHITLYQLPILTTNFPKTRSKYYRTTTITTTHNLSSPPWRKSMFSSGRSSSKTTWEYSALHHYQTINHPPYREYPKFHRFPVGLSCNRRNKQHICHVAYQNGKPSIKTPH